MSSYAIFSNDIIFSPTDLHRKRAHIGEPVQAPANLHRREDQALLQEGFLRGTATRVSHIHQYFGQNIKLIYNIIYWVHRNVYDWA